MSTFYVNVPEIVRTVNALSELNASLKSRINTLVDQEATMNGMWEGEARERFHSAFQSDIAQMRVFSNTVTNYAEVLSRIAQSYVENENRNVDVATTRNY